MCGLFRIRNILFKDPSPFFFLFFNLDIYSISNEHRDIFIIHQWLMFSGEETHRQSTNNILLFQNASQLWMLKWPDITWPLHDQLFAWSGHLSVTELPCSIKKVLFLHHRFSTEKTPASAFTKPCGDHQPVILLPTSKPVTAVSHKPFLLAMHLWDYLQSAQVTKECRQHLTTPLVPDLHQDSSKPRSGLWLPTHRKRRGAARNEMRESIKTLCQVLPTEDQSRLGAETLSCWQKYSSAAYQQAFFFFFFASLPRQKEQLSQIMFRYLS